MSEHLVEQLRRTVMYEGYALYPYRPSMKNHMRWTFGVIFPRVYSEAVDGAEPAVMQAECLIVSSGDATVLAVVHFMHVTDQCAGGMSARGSPQGACEGGKPWQETIERAVPLPEVSLTELLRAPLNTVFVFPRERCVRPETESANQRHAIHGEVELSARPCGPGAFCLTLRVLNTTAVDIPAAPSREQALLHAMVATHMILRLRGGEFISAMDPPAGQPASTCTNIGCWPVLVGNPGDRSAMLAAPIILYDYPQLAPESAGDLFDATEMDEMLTLRLLTLTGDERRSMAGLDLRTRAILDRASNLTEEQLRAMHGVIRELRPCQPPGDDGLPPTREVCVGSALFRSGDRVRLRPGPGADAFDVLLAGRIATIVAIERDFEDRVHLAVTIDDDPGAAEGSAGKIGHRFFFRPEEVESLSVPASGEAP